jgi:hypothetical protein
MKLIYLRTLFVQTFFKKNTAFLYIDFTSLVDYLLLWESILKVTQHKGTAGALF